MQSFIHTTWKFLGRLTPKLSKALIRLKFLPNYNTKKIFALGNILLKLKKKKKYTENL